jgi:hypothetical protein
MSSLKGYTITLARHLGTTPAALYERQRALVRVGLLDLDGRRGPGSGVRATAPSVALLLLSVLASDSLTESEERIRALARARPVGAAKCPYTGAKTLLDALASVLGTTARITSTMEVIVSRTAVRAQIKYYWANEPDLKTSEFAGGRADEPDISISASINNRLLSTIAADVNVITAETEFGGDS